jgi:hypothetical protein
MTLLFPRAHLVPIVIVRDSSSAESPLDICVVGSQDHGSVILEGIKYGFAAQDISTYNTVSD